LALSSDVELFERLRPGFPCSCSTRPICSVWAEDLSSTPTKTLKSWMDMTC